MRSKNRFLAEFSLFLNDPLQEDLIPKKAVDLIARNLSDWCLLELLQEGEVLSPAAVAHRRSKSDELLQGLLPFRRKPQSLAAAVLKEGQPRLFSDSASIVAEFEPELHPQKLADIAGVKSCIFVPLIVHGKRIGLLSGYRRTPRFRKSDLALFSDLGRCIALALHNSRQISAARKSGNAFASDILSLVSHDLKNPVTAVQLNTERLLALHREDSRSRPLLDTILCSAGRLHRMIQDLLDFGKLQSGAYLCERRPHPVDTMIGEVVEMLRPIAEKSGISLIQSHLISNNEITCDRDRILQVLSNLIGNSIKFTPAGGTVEVGYFESPDGLCFEVRDTGIGIPTKDLPRIFDRYWRADRTSNKSTGLGLFIAKGIVGAHGGTIWAESREKIGTSIYFVLPR